MNVCVCASACVTRQISEYPICRLSNNRLNNIFCQVLHPKKKVRREVQLMRNRQFLRDHLYLQTATNMVTKCAYIKKSAQCQKHIY